MFNRLALGLAVPAAALAILTILLLPHGASAAAPDNDNKADASIVVALPFTDTFNNSDATTETDEPKNCNFTKTVWYKLTSPVTGRITVNTYGSDFDTGVAIYTQADMFILCNDDYSGVQSEVSFDAETGQTYWVQAGGFSGRMGNMIVNIAKASDYGQITGTVRSAGDGIALEQICVTLYSSSIQRRAYTSTVGDGTYKLEGLVAGDYYLAFVDCENDTYAGRFYTSAKTTSKAQTITLTKAQVRTGIDANLPLGGTLSGRVTDGGTGLPLDSICINAYTVEDVFFGSTSTDADGMYTLTGLGNDYTLQFASCNSTGTRYITEYYPHVFDQNMAIAVPVAPGQALTGYDIALEIGASISGTVTNAVTGEPLSSPCVTTSRIAGSTLQYVTSTGVNDDGTYTLGGLQAGSYKLYAYNCGGEAKFNDLYYNGRSSVDTANVVMLTDGQARTGIDFSITLDPVAGDGDCTGGVTMSDLMIGLRFLGGVDGGHNCVASSMNLDCTGGTNGRDMLVLERFLAGLPMMVGADCPAPGTASP